MGEVYRARDTHLKRDVAIKVLPQAFAQDLDRLARFQREAELLATLNHPNIAAVYGLEKANGLTGIVLELVEGDTLAEKIATEDASRRVGTAVPLNEVLAIARQIAEALVAARERCHSSRSEAGEHQGALGRNREGAGLWTGKARTTGHTEAMTQTSPGRRRSPRPR
jgi:serine/threonine protein kinase